MSKERKKWQKKQVIHSPTNLFSFYWSLFIFSHNFLPSFLDLCHSKKFLRKSRNRTHREKEDDHAWSHDWFVRRIHVFDNGKTRWSHLSSSWVSKDSSFCRLNSPPPPPRPPRLRRILCVFLVHPLLFYLFCLLQISTLFLFLLDCKIILPSNVKRYFLSFKIQEFCFLIFLFWG